MSFSEVLKHTPKMPPNLDSCYSIVAVATEGQNAEESNLLTIFESLLKALP